MKLDVVEIILVGTNFVFGIFFSVVVSRRIANNFSWRKNRFLFFILLTALYLFEGMSIAAGMFTPVFTFVLAVMTGAVFGLIVKKHDLTMVVKSAKQLSFFTCIPAITMVLIPIICFIYNWDIFSSSFGKDFGIPEFIPFPLNTIFGFFMSILILFITVNIITINGTVRLIKNIYEIKSQSD